MPWWEIILVWVCFKLLDWLWLKVRPVLGVIVEHERKFWVQFVPYLSTAFVVAAVMLVALLCPKTDAKPGADTHHFSKVTEIGNMAPCAESPHTGGKLYILEIAGKKFLATFHKNHSNNAYVIGPGITDSYEKEILWLPSDQLLK